MSLIFFPLLFAIVFILGEILGWIAFILFILFRQIKKLASKRIGKHNIFSKEEYFEMKYNELLKHHLDSGASFEELILFDKEFVEQQLGNLNLTKKTVVTKKKQPPVKVLPTSSSECKKSERMSCTLG